MARLSKQRHSSYDSAYYNINNGICGRWSYNQGVILGGLAELYKAAPNQTYLDEAGKIATAAINLLTDSNLVIHESCEPYECDGDQTQFKGIFIRNLQLLQSVAPDDLYVSVINANANSIWANDRNTANQFGVDWAEYVTPVTASTHSSAMDALVAAIAY
jgi:predicted alpha-1,6-mannanase (GH76 family)